MKLIYTSQDRLMVWNIKNKLEIKGYTCHIRNEYAAGGAGDIAPIDTWPEVWLENEHQFDAAKRYLEKQILNQKEGDDWFCSQCNEKNPESFDSCWNCSENKP